MACDDGGSQVDAIANDSDAESTSTVESSSGSESSASSELSAFFGKPKKKKKTYRLAAKGAKGAAEVMQETGVAEKVLTASASVSGDAGSDSDAGLSVFFSAPKRKTKLKPEVAQPAAHRSTGPVGEKTIEKSCDESREPDEKEASSQASASPTLQASSWQRWADLLGTSATQKLEASQDSDGGPRQSFDSSRRASRTAWKQRGRSDAESSPANSGADMTAADESEVATTDLPKSKSLMTTSGVGRRTASGMYRPVPRLAMDSTRCHWLLPPESLLIRVDAETSAFLQRQWLGIQAAGARSAGRGASGARHRRSIPARLHAGWLQQTLRPKGWLASIPEDEVRTFSMPLELVGEPDRGPPWDLRKAG